MIRMTSTTVPLTVFEKLTAWATKEASDPDESARIFS
jgi:hypothetical protein